MTVLNATQIVGLGRGISGGNWRLRSDGRAVETGDQHTPILRADQVGWHPDAAKRSLEERANLALAAASKDLRETALALYEGNARLLRRLDEAEAQAKAAERKAALWDGLTGAARLKMGGWAGLNETHDRSREGYVHFSLEAWTHGGSDGEREQASNALAVRILTAFAEASNVVAGTAVQQGETP